MCYLRNSAKAIIIDDGHIFLVKNMDYLGSFYLLPGGGQKAGENFHEALKRECKEFPSIRYATDLWKCIIIQPRSFFPESRPLFSFSGFRR